MEHQSEIYNTWYPNYLLQWKKATEDVNDIHSGITSTIIQKNTLCTNKSRVIYFCLNHVNFFPEKRKSLFVWFFGGWGDCLSPPPPPPRVPISNNHIHPSVTPMKLHSFKYLMMSCAWWRFEVIEKEKQALSIFKVWHFSKLNPLSIIILTMKPKPLMPETLNLAD